MDRKIKKLFIVILVLCQFLFIKLSNAEEKTQTSSPSIATAENKGEPRNGLGLDFLKRVYGKRTFTSQNIYFTGKVDIANDKEITGNFSYTKSIENVDINIEPPILDIGIFYRIGRFKIGWIPTTLTYNNSYKKDIVYYPKGEWGGQNIEWPLGGYDATVKTYNLFYLEVSGLHTSDKTFYTNLIMRSDYYHLKRNFITYKYPFGSEWNQQPIIIDKQEIEKKFGLLSLGLKLDYNLVDIFPFILDKFKYNLKGNGWFLYDFPIGYRNVSGYSINVGLGLEF